MSEQTTNGTLDPRFSDDEAAAAAWPDVDAGLAAAELYWITTVRADGRPHTTPTVGLWRDGAFLFCTGRREQKHHNLGANPAVTVTTGANAWQAGTDVVVEGTAERVTGLDKLSSIADSYLDKYGEAWRFSANEEGFGGPEEPGGEADVFRVPPGKVLVFAKAPHGQTTFRF